MEEIDFNKKCEAKNSARERARIESNCRKCEFDETERNIVIKKKTKDSPKSVNGCMETEQKYKCNGKVQRMSEQQMNRQLKKKSCERKKHIASKWQVVLDRWKKYTTIIMIRWFFLWYALFMLDLSYNYTIHLAAAASSHLCDCLCVQARSSENNITI